MADIEKLATNAVNSSISKTDFLSTNINENDKEPSWDGHIYIYNSKIKRKNSLVGRVPIQVKGKRVKNINRDQITYPVNITDLRNYFNDGGVIYFVVLLCQQDFIPRIFYACLLPVKIQNLLKECSNTTSISLKLIQFPDDNQEKCEIFLNFFKDKVKQSPENKFFSLDEVPSIYNVQFEVTTFGPHRDPLEYLFSHETYLYAVKDGIKIPIDFLGTVNQSSTVINKTVFIGNREFYKSYNVVRKKDRYEIHLGKSNVLTFPGDLSCTFNFRLQGNLKERILDQEFLLALIKTEAITIDHCSLPFKEISKRFSSADKINIEKELERLKAVKKALDILHVKQDLNVSKFTQRDINNTNLLIQAFVDGKPVSINEDIGSLAYSIIEISNLQLLLIFEKQHNGQYSVKNFFEDTIAMVSINEKTKEKSRTSQFLILKKDNFIKLSNINYEKICESIFSVKAYPNYFAEVNMLALEMLSAYDDAPSKKNKLLDTAIKIFEWLLDNKHFDRSISLLNLLQAIRRKRNLNDDEIGTLTKLVENGNQKEIIMVGAYLLLDNAASAKYHFLKLSEEEKNGFKKFPIYIFWK